MCRIPALLYERSDELRLEFMHLGHAAIVVADERNVSNSIGQNVRESELSTGKLRDLSSGRAHDISKFGRHLRAKPILDARHDQQLRRLRCFDRLIEIMSTDELLDGRFKPSRRDVLPVINISQPLPEFRVVGGAQWMFALAH